MTMCVGVGWGCAYSLEVEEYEEREDEGDEGDAKSGQGDCIYSAVELQRTREKSGLSGRRRRN